MTTLPQAAPAAVPPPGPGPPAIRRVGRRRRPSGEPPPLPRHLNASGKWWLGLSVLVVVAWVVVLVTNSVRVVDVADTRVLQAIADLRTPWLTRGGRVAGVLATAAGVFVIWQANLLVLVVLRRWRHLFVTVGVGLVAVGVASAMASALRRPRPYGIEILGSWAGFSMPSLPMTVI